jgi:DNA-binding response OmpR family regulator
MGGPIFVLLVDDQAFADAAATCLESAGLRTLVVSASIAALDVFDIAIDVLIADALPTAEPQRLALMRRITNKRPIILLSTYPEVLEKKVELSSGVVCEPFELAELCRNIKVRFPTVAKGMPLTAPM